MSRKQPVLRQSTTGTNWPALRDKVRATDKSILATVIAACDGHSIFTPKQLLEAGLDPSIVAAFTKDHFSDPNDVKQTIFVDGEPVECLVGVHGLQLLEFVAAIFGVASWKMGRGSKAEHLKEQLLALWK